MGHAWLDSLSEDWVSQHGSDASVAGPSAASAPAHGATTPSKTNRGAVGASRIPRLNQGPKNPPNFGHENSSGILSERSVNENFASIARRTPSQNPSKLSQEIKIHERGRYSSRSVSASTSGSVVHNTIHKSQSASPIKRRGETPEWKRRLIYGDLSYGEQPDLFTSAATGLENMFKPPAPVPDVPNEESYEESVVQHEATPPSSPPLYTKDPSTVEIHVDESVQELPQARDRRAPTSMQYRWTEESLEQSLDSEQSMVRESCTHGGSTTEQTAFSAHQPDRVSPDSRKVSGRSDVRHEDFSPILLERRQASDGKETFGPADLPPNELRKRLEKLRQNQMVLAGNHEASETAYGNAETTGDYEGLGMFVNFRRGGRSGDGSFRHHVLSSGINDTSELNPEESLQASTPKQFPTVRMETFEETGRLSAPSPDLPRPPNPSPQKRQDQGNFGSPLKLFQPYDTFTNQTLLRRLSQFQGSADDESRLQSVREVEDYSAEFDQGDFANIAARSRAQQAWEDEEYNNQNQSSASYNQFGTGKFDGYEFNDEYSYQSDDVSCLDGDKENYGPEDSVQRPRIFDVSHDSSPTEDAEELLVQRKRGKSNASTASRRSNRTEADRKRELYPPFPNVAELVSTPRRKDRASEIKRPRTSPSKDPTPKRRRTLHKSDVAYGVEGHSQAIDPVQISHQQMQSIIGKKRKDARYGDPNELADKEVLATREMLRPRTPTPTQRSSLQRDRPPLAEIEKSPARSTRKPLPAAPHSLVISVDSDRKPSIKTEDFINEANKIMAMIRSKAGIASGLASLEESDAENIHQQQQQNMDSSYQESTQEPFSRPPSREGRPPLTRMSTRQEDPEVVERLKKYEEPSDMGDIIGSSVRSTALAQDALRSARERTDGDTMDSNGSRPFLMDDNVISDPPNIRISLNPNWDPNGLIEGLRKQEGDRSRKRSPSDSRSGRKHGSGQAAEYLDQAETWVCTAKKAPKQLSPI
jgi:protein NUD1